MPIFGSGTILQETRWTAFKAVAITQKGLAVQYEDTPDTYDIFAVDGTVVYRAQIFKGEVPLNSDYSQFQNDADKADFEANYLYKVNQPLSGAVQVSNFLLSDATLTTSGSTVVTNLTGAAVTLLINIKNSPTGSTPVITFSIQDLDPVDGTTVLGSPTTGDPLNSISTQELTATIQSSAILVSWVVTGTTPSFTGVNVAVAQKSSVVNVTLTGLSIITADQGAPASLSDGWPVKVTDGSNVLGTGANPVRVDPTGTTTQPVSDGGGSLTVDGTITANVGTTGGLALDATLTGGTAKAIVRGGTKGATTPADVTSTAEGADHQALDVQIYHGGAAKDPTQIRALTNADVVSSEVTKWIGSTAPTVGQKTSANSLPVVIASDQSPVPISGSITATNPSVSTNNAAAPASSTQIGGTDGTNLQAATIFDADSGGGTQYVLGTILRKSASGGSVEAGTASDPLRVDPTGTTTQPVSGTVTANVGTTGGLALDATLTGGTTKAIVRGGTKGATTPADVTSTDEGADHQALDIQIYHGGVAKDPTQIRALTNADVVSSEVTTWIGSSAPTVGQKAMAASLPVVIAFDQSAFPTFVTPTDNAGIGPLNALNANVSVDVVAATGVAIIAGTLLGTIVPEISLDGGTTWVGTVFVSPAGVKSASLTGTFNADVAYDIELVGGVSQARVRVSAYTSGTSTAWVRSKQGLPSTQTGLTDAELRATAVPVSGTVTANVGTTGGLALDATLTGGTTKAIVRGGTKGATTPADVTSTAEGADHQSLDVQIYHGGAAKDPTQIRALTNADVVSSEVTKWIGSTAPTVGQKTSANSIPTVIASDQSAVPVSDGGGSLTVDGTVTANQGTAAALSGAWPVKVTDGTNTLPTGDAVSRAIFEKITDGTNTAAVKAASTAAVATDPALVVALSPNNPVTTSGGTQDPNNSTTTPLLANATFTGAYTNCIGYDVLQLYVQSDQTSADIGILITWDYDGTGTQAFDDAEQQFFYNPPGWQYFPVRLRAPFYRVTYTNGVTNQTSFGLAAILKIAAPDATVLPGQGLDTAVGYEQPRANLVAGTTAVTSGQAKVLLTDSQGRLILGGGTVTANQGTAAALSGKWPVQVTDGTNTLPTGDAVGRAIFEKITDGTNVAAVSATGKLRVSVLDAQDVFTQLVIGQRLAQIQITFNALAPASLVTVTTSGTGTTSGPNNGQGSFSTGSGATAQATGVTTNSVAYSPHQELFAAFTAAYTSPSAASSYQRFGLYNATDGFAFGYNGLNFGLWTRFNTTDTFTAQTSWNGDTCQGGGTSKFQRAGSPEALAPNLINLYRVRFGWLGIAPVVFEILSPDGEWVTVHTVRYPNQGVSVSLTNPNLPMTVDVSKTASDGAILTITTGCWVAGTSAAATPNFVGTGTIASNNTAVSIPTAGVGSLTLSMSGTWTGTLAFQYSVDGFNWKTDVVYDQTTGAFISSTTTNKTIEAPIASYRQYRVVSTAWSSGVVTILYSTASGINWTHTQTLLTDGNANGPVAVKAASTAAVAADPALVVSLSPNSTTPITVDRTGAGSITGAGQTVALSAVGLSNVAFQFAGTWTATLIFEGTVDNTNWFSIPGFQVGLGGGGITTLTTSTTHNGIYRVSAPGFLQVRVRCSAFTSGPATVTVEGSIGSISPVLNGFLDPNNSTNTALGSGVQYVGTLTSTAGFDVIVVRVISDQGSAANGLQIQWSHDGGGVSTDAEQRFTYSASSAVLYPFRVRGPFYRLLYTNGVTGQATFEFAAVLKTASPDGTVLPGQQEGLYEVTRPTAIAGKDSGSIYRAIRSGTDGNLSTSRTATANVTGPSGAATLNTDGLGTVSAQVTGTWTGTLVFEGSVDGTNYSTLPASTIGGAAGASQVTSTTANGMWSLATGGLISVRLRASALSSGTAVMTLVGSPSGSTTKSINPAVTITSPSAGAAGLYAFVSAYGTLRTSNEGPQLFHDSFEGSVFDTQDLWVLNQGNGGSVAPVSGQATFTVGTTNLAFAELSSQANMVSTGLGFLVFGCVVKLEAAAILNNHRFWGLGWGGSPFGNHISEGIGFEVDTDGILYASVFTGGSRNAQALTKPTDGAQHRYAIVIRSDLILWYQDSIETPVASLAYSGPAVTSLPIRFHCYNNNIPGSNPTFTVSGVGMQDSSPSSIALSDGAFPWRKAAVTAPNTVAVASDPALVVALSPNGQLSAVANVYGTDLESQVVQLLQTLLLEARTQTLLLTKLVNSSGAVLTQRELDSVLANDTRRDN
jgi:hypothetical protein